MTGPELFQLALEEAGSEIALAQQLGYTNLESANTQFKRWKKGSTQMSFDTTIALLEIAGLLRHDK